MVNTNKEFLSCSRKPHFKSFQIYDRQLAAVDMRPKDVLLNSPIAAGVIVLETSKLKMLKTWYSLLKEIYGDNIRLLLSDTDSFISLITDCEKAFDTMEKNHTLFDMSNLPAPYKKDADALSTVGKLKDELGGKDEILSFVGLRSKCYALKLLNEEEKKAKGLPKSVMQDLCFEDYYNALFTPTIAKRHDYQSLRSVKQRIFTLSEHRSGLASFDDKRVICSNKIDTIPYFYDPIESEQLEEQHSDGDEISDETALYTSPRNKMSSSGKTAVSADPAPMESVKVTDRLWINVKEYSDEIWYHFNTKKKSISLTSKDMSRLFKNKRELIVAGKKIEHAMKKTKSKKKNKKQKKSKHEDKHSRDMASTSENSSTDEDHFSESEN